MESKLRTVDFLKEQLERTNYWLSFAEAKNGAVIALNIAIMTIMVDLYSYAPTLCTVVLSLLTVSCIICLISFLPDLKNYKNNDNNQQYSIMKKLFLKLKLHSKKDYSQDKSKKINLLFYADIAKLNEEQFIDSFKQSYENISKENSYVNKIEEDYLSEIYLNSCIAKEKYELFSIAGIIDVLTLFLCIFVFIIA